MATEETNKENRIKLERNGKYIVRVTSKSNKSSDGTPEDNGCSYLWNMSSRRKDAKSWRKDKSDLN